MKIRYVPKTFSAAHAAVIEQANTIIDNYAAQGFDLSLRQLYYQFVSRALIANRDSEYKRLGSIINDGRLAGLIDWNRISDRGRNLAGGYGVDSDPRDHVRSIADWFQLDRWKGQAYRPEVWVEKDALSGVVGRVANELDVPYMACKGYMSQSEMWAAGRRLRLYRRDGQIPIIIHLGDHDPSGIDMTRDIADRLSMFAEGYVEVRRIALNMDQVQLYDPPPNPAKTTDSRATGYIDEFGDESWELDALEPTVLATLIRDEVESLRDDDVLETVKAQEAKATEAVRSISDNWMDVLDYLRGEGWYDVEEEGDA